MQSVLSVDSVLRDLLAEGASDKGIAEIMYHKGTRSLMEDGVAKAFNGLSTLESVFKVTRVVPVVFEALLAATSEAESTHDGEPAKPEPAFHEFHGVADNEPLFRVTSQGKVRTKPFVLVVEDDPDQRAILEMVLRSVDYEVAMAVDGKDALNKIRADRPDLIISDLMMPNMDGKELVSTVKSDPELQSIPVLMLTVVADADKEYELLDMGANDYCDKTVQRKVLLKRVEKLLGRSYA